MSSKNPEKLPVILLDVAGTTTSSDFVQEKLIPYASTHAEDYLKSNWEDENVKAISKKLISGEELTVEKALESFKTLSEKDSNNEIVKELEGLIYKKAYEDGLLKAHVFAEVPEALETWSKTKCIAIFSSGSIEAQKLLFSHTTEGNLTKHISHYFDLSIGSKTADATYKKIAEELSISNDDLTYINDNVDEAKAAKQSGATAILIKREGNKEIAEDDLADFVVLSSLLDLAHETAGKRKNEEHDGPVEEAPPSKVAKTEFDKSTEEKETISETMEVDPCAVSKEVKSSEPATIIPTSANQDVEMADNIKKDEPDTKVEETTNKTTQSESNKDSVAEMETEEKQVEKTEVATVNEEKVKSIETNDKKCRDDKTEDKISDAEKKAESENADVKTEERKEKDTEKIENDTGTEVQNESTPISKENDNSKELSKTEVVEDKKTETDKAEDKIEDKGVEIAEKNSVEEEKPKESNVVENEIVSKATINKSSDEGKEMVENEKEKVEKDLKKDEKNIEQIESPAEAEPVDEMKNANQKTEIAVECNEESSKDESKAVETNDVNKEEVKKAEVKSDEENEATTTTEKVPKENVNGEASTSEEKENQSDLANGTSSKVENGTEDVKNNGDAVVETDSTTDEEIKVKKLEEKSETTPVSVEA